jgi:hypothetical protein
LDQLSAPRILYHERFDVIRKPPPKFTDLLMEIQIKVMSHMDGESLQRLIKIMDIDLPGVVQYVVDSPTSIKPGRIKMVNELDHLKKNHCMINLVFISSFEPVNVDKALDLFSHSINHVYISGLKITSGDHHQDLTQKLTKFLNNSSLCTMVTISHCTGVVVQDVNIDPSRLKFKYLKFLELENCSFIKSDVTFLELQDVERLSLVDCPRDLLEMINFTWGRRKFIKLRQIRIPGLFDEGMVLRAKHIDVQWLDVEQVRCVEELHFEGFFLNLLMAQSEQRRIISNIRAPRLRSLDIICTGSIPSIKRLYAPKLSKVILKEGLALLINDSIDPTDWLFLSDIRVLKLCYVTIHLYHLRFVKLEKLIIYIKDNIKDVPNDFPMLRTLWINLSAGADRAPKIRADKLLHLEIFYTFNVHFNASSLIPTLSQYPRLDHFVLDQRWIR